MKKIFVLLAAAMAFVGCGSKSYVVEGTIEGFEGQVAVMDFNGEMILDLATVKNGSFQLEVENDGSGPQIATFAINNTPVAPIFLDGNNIKVEGNIYGGLVITGTAANDAYVEFTNLSQEFSSTLPEDFDPENPSPEVMDSIAKLLGEQFEKNKDNLFGAFMILVGNIPAETPAQMLAYMDALNEDIKEYAPVKEMRGFVEQAILQEEL